MSIQILDIFLQLLLFGLTQRFSGSCSNLLSCSSRSVEDVRSLPIRQANFGGRIVIGEAQLPPNPPELRQRHQPRWWQSRKSLVKKRKFLQAGGAGYPLVRLAAALCCVGKREVLRDRSGGPSTVMSKKSIVALAMAISTTRPAERLIRLLRFAAPPAALLSRGPVRLRRLVEGTVPLLTKSFFSKFELGRYVEGILLARRRCPEAGAVTTAQL